MSGAAQFVVARAGFNIFEVSWVTVPKIVPQQKSGDWLCEGHETQEHTAESLVSPGETFYSVAVKVQLTYGDSVDALCTKLIPFIYSVLVLNEPAFPNSA